MTTGTMDRKKYGRLLARALPGIVETKAEYERLLGEARRLMERDEDELSIEETRLLDLLVNLIEQYEEKHYPIGPASPRDLLLHLMEARNLTHKDVWSLFGSKGIASEVLNGKRSISKTQARKLATFFHVSADLFI